MSLTDLQGTWGGVAGGDRSGPLHPGVRSLDAIDVRDAGFQKAQAGGITTANVMPGSGHLMSGQTYYMKLRGGKTAEAIAFVADEGFGALFTTLFALGRHASWINRPMFEFFPFFDAFRAPETWLANSPRFGPR